MLLQLNADPNICNKVLGLADAQDYADQVWYQEPICLALKAALTPAQRLVGSKGPELHGGIHVDNDRLDVL